ncbi:A24 family peptidase [Clostridium sp.]|uniref:prepilin peptidase n=1 Tax=Clostridium sp. TaxID=1506 RepID=UPI00260D8C34|nr:A24 family peptidase [Clostridium sp.]
MELLILILGLVIGSFLNVCIYRIQREESIAFPPSHCTNCGYNLRAMDLIPVISYIFLRGKCRKCKEKISIRYPIVELINGVMYLVLFLKLGLSYIFIFNAIFFSLLLVISLIDLESKEVYLSTIVFGLTVAVIYLLIEYFIFKGSIINNVLGGVIGYSIIMLIVILTKGMGEGDAEIAGICGLLLGIKGIILALFIAIVTAGIIGSIILLLKLKDKKSEIAFGPYIAIGTVISVLYGTRIIEFYLILL